MNAFPTAAGHDPRAHDEFLRLLPAIRRHARLAFGAIRCPHDREDAMAEVVAHAWVHFLTTGVTGRVTAEDLATATTNFVRSEMAQAVRLN
jgi:hypothetical protein